MELLIRDATPSDAPLIAGFNAAMALETESISLDSHVLLAGVRALLLDPSKGRYFLAESAGLVVGQTMITYEWSDWRNGAFWWIQSVYVQPHARRQGVFRALFDHLLIETRRSGGVGLRLYVERRNENARRAYSRLGMTPAAYEMLEIDFVLHR
jgi:GNAT superfamily N-acetyltransferase